MIRRPWADEELELLRQCADAPIEPASHRFVPDFPGEAGYRVRCATCGREHHPPIPTPRDNTDDTKESKR